MDSYDVFETALLRVVGEPSSLFIFLGKRAFKQGWVTKMPAYFKFVRTEAEREAYRKHQHPTLDQIYKILAELLEMPPNQMEKLKREELRLEADWSKPNPTVLKLINESRKRYGRVLFLSDMYLPRDFIEKNLREKGLFTEDDTLYLSNQEGAGKSDGRLFHKVLKREQISSVDLHHHGNCLRADFEVPKQLGIKASAYREGNLNANEKELENLSESTDGISSLWSGTSRRARCGLAVKTRTQLRKTILETATSVAGPILTTFVHWSLLQAAEDEVENLAFIARDGQILYKIAKRLKHSDQRLDKINLHYLYGSRQAWRPASIFELRDFERNWILEGSHELTREKVLARVGLDNSFAKLLPLSTNPEPLWAALKDQLGQTILDSSSKRRKQLLSYFKSKELLEGKKLGFVEIGCTGTTLRSVESIFNQNGIPSPKNYFFALSNAHQKQELNHASTYYCNEKENIGLHASSDFNYFVLLEMFCAASHGRTLGYRDTNDGIEPILGPKQEHWNDQGSTDLLQKGITSFAKAYADSPLIAISPSSAIPLVTRVISKFWQEPDSLIAKTWGSYRKEHDQSGFEAPEMGRVHKLRDLLYCIRAQQLPTTWWSAATHIRTSQTTLKVLKFGIFVGKQLTKVRIGLGSLKKTLLRQN